MRKVNNNIKVICGALVGFILGGYTVLGANQTIQAILNNQIKISLNGQVQTFKDELTGEIQYPITYNNRTYLPLRNIAQFVGLEVDYDGNENVAILSTEKTIEHTKNNYYIIEDSNISLIDSKDIGHLSYDELEYAKNEIFARYGYDFQTNKIRTYFNNQEWYKPVLGNFVSTDSLNQVEQKNVKILDDEINKRLESINNNNFNQEFNMIYNLEKCDIESILKDNGLDVNELERGKYKYKFNNIHIGSLEDSYEAIICFEIDYIHECSYRNITDVHFYLLKESKVIIDFYGGYGKTNSIDDIGTIYVLKDYIFNIKVGTGSYSDIRMYDKNGALIYEDSGLGISVETRAGKVFEKVYDVPAGYLEGAIGDYNFYKSIYELYVKDGKIVKKLVSIDYSDILFTAQT